MIENRSNDSINATRGSISKEKVWLKHFDLDSVSEELPKKTVYGYLRDLSQAHLNNVALNYYGRKISYAKLFWSIDRCASAFTALGVKKGDIVSFVAVAVPECIIAIYALNKIGATANTIDPRMDVENIRRMIVESESKILLTLNATFSKIQEIRDDIKQDKIVVMSFEQPLPTIKRWALKLKIKMPVEYGKEVISWDEFIGAGKGTPPCEAEYDGDATFAIAYTGGTTGFPKGVLLTNDSVNAVTYSFRHCGVDYEIGDKFLGIIPVFSSYGIVCGLHMPLCMGCELIPIPRFIPAEFGKLVRQHKPNHMISTPAFYEIMMNSEALRGMDLSFLKTLGSGGDTMNKGLEHKLHKWMKLHNVKYPLAQGYGMSELSAAASFCVNDRYKKGSVGVPLIASTISVFDPETGEELGYNEIGEICACGPSIMKGYFKRPEETAHVMRLHDDGNVWVHSGDLGYMDEDGFVYISGRVKRMITRFDGHKVFPVNIESVVSRNKNIHNCSVIGVNDREHSQGQYPMVIVEFMPGTNKARVCKEIFDECQEKLEERGRPVAVLSIDEIPLTGMGKNDYKLLEKQYREYDYTK